MTTENVNVRFTSSGERVIIRNLNELGQSADRATRGIYLLQRAMFVLGGAGVIAALTRAMDTLTNFENRLKLTATSLKNVEDVQQDLFNVANNSRSAFESVSELYSRMALSTRDLGVSQQETLKFTESLSKATILSGASAREANAALIQLSQGIASDRLSGDELRSVLEQLPYVADVIVDELNRMQDTVRYTRGDLKDLGAEGEISGELVLRAFQNASDEIDKNFANTVPTIGQALTVLNNNWLKFLDSFDDTTGISAAVAKIILAVANNIEYLAGAAVLAGSSIAAAFVGKGLSAIFKFVNGLRAMEMGNAKLAASETAYSASLVRTTQANIAANRARQATLTTRMADLALMKKQLQQQVLDAQYSVKNGRARSLATGQFINLTAAKTNLLRVTKKLEIVESVEAATASRLTAARGAGAAATNAAAAAQARHSASLAASNSLTARLQRNFPLLTGVVRGATGAFAALGAILLANPIGLAIAAAAAAVTAFVLWGNQIKVTEDKVVGLKDAVVAAFQVIGEDIGKAIAPFTEKFTGAIEFVRDNFNIGFTDILTTVWDTIKGIVDAATFFPRVFVSSVTGIIAAFKTLPGGAGSAIDALVNIFVTGFENIANIGIRSINSLIGAINKLANTGVGKKLGFEGIGEIAEANFDSLRTNLGDGGQAAADAFQDAFSETMQGSTVDGLIDRFGETYGDRIIDRAQENIKKREQELNKDFDNGGEDYSDREDYGDGKGKKGKKGADKVTFAELMAQMDKEIALLKLTAEEREIGNKLLDIEKKLKRELTDSEEDLATAKIKSLIAAQRQADLLEEIKGPMQDVINQQEALNALHEQGRISVEQYLLKLRELQGAADGVSQTFSGGFRKSINDSIMSAQEFGEAVGGTIVGAANNASDAIVEFAKTGKFSIRDLFAELFSQLLKLAAQQLLLQLLGSVMGVPGVGMSGGATGGGGLLGFSGGGSILPNGPGSTDSQVVSFAKRPDERVDILTPGQQKSQSDAMNGKGGGQTVVQSPPVNVAAVLSPDDIVGVFDSDAGQTKVIRILENNAATVRSILGG